MNTNEIKRLPIHSLMSMANAACDKYGLDRVLPMEMQKLYQTRALPCVLRTNNKFLLWIDPEYIALQIGDGEVVYLYLSMKHINEERNGYKTASRERGISVTIPKEIREQFDRAESLMKYTNRSFYITPAAGDLGLHWVDCFLKQVYSEARKISEQRTEELTSKWKEAIA